MSNTELTQCMKACLRVRTHAHIGRIGGILAQSKRGSGKTAIGVSTLAALILATELQRPSVPLSMSWDAVHAQPKRKTVPY
eukprot:3936631-Amphidinium_carterae.1